MNFVISATLAVVYKIGYLSLNDNSSVLMLSMSFLCPGMLDFDSDFSPLLSPGVWNLDFSLNFTHLDDEVSTITFVTKLSVSVQPE